MGWRCCASWGMPPPASMGVILAYGQPIVACTRAPPGEPPGDCITGCVVPKPWPAFSGRCWAGGGLLRRGGGALNYAAACCGAGAGQATGRGFRLFHPQSDPLPERRPLAAPPHKGAVHRAAGVSLEAPRAVPGRGWSPCRRGPPGRSRWVANQPIIEWAGRPPGNSATGTMHRGGPRVDTPRQ